MATKSKFQIPSLQQMESVDKDPGPKPKSLFESHMKSKKSVIHSSSSNDCPNKAWEKQNSNASSATQRGNQIESNTGDTKSQIHVSEAQRPAQKTISTVPNVGSSESDKKDSGNPSSSASSTVSDPKSSAVEVSPPRPGKSNSLLVSPRQRGNPILKHVRNVIWEFSDIVPDYVMGQTTCGLFLSLRYHNLNPNYIYERLKQLGHSYDLRVVLVQIDIKDPHHALKELAKICILADCTLILAWTPEEAGRYLETYKAFENKPPDLIMEKTDTNYVGRVTDCLTSVRKVNKTDATTLLSTFGTVENIVQASEEDLSLCPGFGPQKAKKLYSVFHEPLLQSKKRKATESEPSTSNASGSPLKIGKSESGSPAKKNGKS